MFIRQSRPIRCAMFSLVLTGVALLGLPAKAQAPANADAATGNQETVTTIRSTTRLVQVSVVVMDKKGEPITGLKMEDFAIFDESKPQEIAFFNAGVAAPEQAPPVLPANVFTNRLDLKGQDQAAVTVVLFDLLNTAFQDQSQVRRQVIGFLKSLKPQDHVAIYGLTTQLLLLHEFTQDASALVEAVNKLNLRTSAAYDVSNPEYVHVSALDGAPGWQQFEAALNKENQHVADESDQDRYRTTSEALQMIANHVAAVPGRKNLVWIAGSFPLAIFANGVGDPARVTSTPEQASATARALNRANLAVYPLDSSGVAPTPTMDSSERGNPTTLQCADCINKAPMSSSAMFDRQVSRDGERMIAESTGGQAFYGNNDIGPAMKKVFDDGRWAYTIGFYPNHEKWDGKYRKLKVEVKGAGKLRYRAGYFADGPQAGGDEVTAKEAIQEAGTSPLEATRLGMIVSAKVPPAPSRAVEFHVGVDPKQLMLRRVEEKEKGAVDLYFVQRNAKGETLAAESQRIGLDLPQKQYEYLSKVGLVFGRHVTINAEAVELRVVVRDAGSGALGSVSVPVTAVLANSGNAGSTKTESPK
jgi:VWFA-related protein